MPEVGAVGDWVGGPGVREAAESWLTKQGCRVARGPMEQCTWFTYRANLGPFDEAPFAFEPVERAERWERAGYEPVAQYVSALADHDRQIASAREQTASLSASGWQLNPIPSDAAGNISPEDFREAVSLVHQLSTAAFGEAFGYVPVPEEALQAWYAPMRSLVDPDLTLVARTPDDEPAGFLFSIPDFAQPDRGWFLVKTLAVLPEHRKLGVGSWLVAAVHRIARRKGYGAGVHCLMWTGSRSTDISRHGGEVFRQYALLEKDL
jgi:GNAT superfamily N-acetyltransferase